MQGTRNIKSKFIVVGLLCLISIFLFAAGLNFFQDQIILGEIEKEMISENERVREYYKEAKMLRNSIDSTIEKYMNDALELISFRFVNDRSFEITDQSMKELKKTLDVDNVMIIDTNGKIKASAIPTETLKSDTAVLPGVSLSEVSASDTLAVTTTSHPPYEEDGSSAPEDYYLYVKAVNKDYIAVLEDGDEKTEYFRDKMDPWDYILKYEVVGTGGYVFAWSAVDNKILYYPEEKFKGKDISSLGIDPQQIEDGQFVWKNVNGAKTYLYPVFDGGLNAWVICACGEKSLFDTPRDVCLLITIVFAIFAGVLAYYEILLLKSRGLVTESSTILKDNNPFFQNKKIRFMIFSLFSVILILMSSSYLQTLYRFSGWAKRSEGTVKSAKEALSERETFIEKYPVEYNSKKECLARMISGFLEKNPDRISVSTLNELVERLFLVELQVRGMDNNVIAVSSNTAVKENTAETEGGDETDPSVSEVKIVMSGSNDQLMGTLLMSYSTIEMTEILNSQNTHSALSRVQPGEGSYVFSLNRESGLLTSHPDTVYIGKSAEEFGLTQQQILDNMCSVAVINRKAYYILSGSRGKDMLYAAISEADLLRQCLPVEVMILVAAIALMNLIGLPLYKQKEEDDADVQEQKKSDRMGKDTAEYKAFHILLMFMIGLAAIVAAYSLIKPSGETITVLDYVLDGNWQPGLNIFALTSSLVTLSRGCIVIFLMRRMAYLLTGIFPIRIGTIIRMLTGLLSYVGMFFILYMCCIDFGMPATALMASAGMVSVVLGIGANSLVGDIIAGMFLLLEGYVQVGDTIEVNGFVGIVQEMGIRVTTLYNVGGSVVKIIPNREVQNVVHRSLCPTSGSNEFIISFDEDLEQVEALFKEELEKMTEELDGFDGKPVYQGVTAVGENGLVLKIRYKAKEKDRHRLNREINRRIFMMFARNNIKIPYQHVTLYNDEKSS